MSSLVALGRVVGTPVGWRRRRIYEFGRSRFLRVILLLCQEFLTIPIYLEPIEVICI
ncbi:MAG TPA: hypothetical protein V6D12_05175 [Candidatus Obscuribacterales bacterium]